jgi:hypothetical protein
MSKCQKELEFESKTHLCPSLPKSVQEKVHGKLLLKVETSAPLLRKSVLVLATELATRDHIWPVLNMKPWYLKGANGERRFTNFNTGDCFHQAYASLGSAVANMVPYAIFSDGDSRLV